MSIFQQKKRLSLQNHSSKGGAGFTLVEILVSLAVFLVCMTIVLGSILSILDINNKAQSKKTAIDNLDFALESLSRTVRFGTNYHCGAVGDLTVPRDCAQGDTSLSIRASDGTLVTYSLATGALTKSINSGTAYPITSSELTVTSLAFRVFGSYAYGTDFNQPQVIMTISGFAGSAGKAKLQSAFNLETTISQRKLDI